MAEMPHATMGDGLLGAAQKPFDGKPCLDLLLQAFNKMPMRDHDPSFRALAVCLRGVRRDQIQVIEDHAIATEAVCSALGLSLIRTHFHRALCSKHTPLSPISPPPRPPTPGLGHRECAFS